MPLPTFGQVCFWVFTVIFAGIGAYMGAYLKKKGENLATHEELDKLIVQMQATTKATKAIEAKILDRVWDRQKQWELTRDAAIRLMDAQGRLEDAGDDIARIAARMRGFFNSPTPFEADAALEQWRAAHRSMTDAISFANFVCWTKQASDAIAEYNFVLGNFRDVPREELFHKIVSSASASGFAFCALRNAIRNELRLQEKEPSSYLLSMPQPSGPLTSPAFDSQDFD